MARTATLTKSTAVKVVTGAQVSPEPSAPKAKESRMEVIATIVPQKVSLAILTPERLKALAFVSTYSTEDPKSTSPRGHGYQREAMAERFPGIGRYYSKNDNRHRIPTLIASVRVYTAKDRTRFNNLFGQGQVAKIHQEFGKDVFSIVDGQHRMGGLFYQWEKDEDFNADIPVNLYYGLTYLEEAQLFDDVNTTQRKLPKALIDATKVHTEAGTQTHEQRLREIAFALAEDGDSVWRDDVNMTGGPKDRRPITFSSLNRSVGAMLNKRVLGRLEERGMDGEDVAKRFWSLVSKACYPAWFEQPRTVENESQEMVEEAVQYRLKELVGVSAVSKLGADILTTALDRSKTGEEFWEVVAEYVSKLGGVDWEKRRNNPYVATSSGFGGMGHLYDLLYAYVYMGQEPGVPVEET